MKPVYIYTAVLMFMSMNAYAQDKPKGVVVEVYGKKGVFKKDEFLACEKTYEEEMKVKCKEVEGKINKDLSGLQEGGCWDQVAQARDVCQGKAFVGNVGEPSVAGYETEEYKPEPAKKAGKAENDDDLL